MLRYCWFLVVLRLFFSGFDGYFLVVPSYCSFTKAPESPLLLYNHNKQEQSTYTTSSIPRQEREKKHTGKLMAFNKRCYP